MNGRVKLQTGRIDNLTPPGDQAGVPAVGGLKFSIAQNKIWKKCQLGEVVVGGSASWGKRQLED